MSRCSLFDGRIPYARTGEGADRIVVINGGQGFVRRADPARLARDASRLARLLPRGASFTLLGYDPNPRAGLSADDIVGEVARFIEAEGRGPVTLAGVSYGGLVATRLAAQRPELVARLILIASANRFSTEGRRRVERQIVFAQIGDFRSFAGDFAAIFRRRWLNGLLRLSVKLGHRRLDRGMAEPRTIVCYLRAMLAAPPPDLSAITAPVLIVGGAEDQFFKGSMQAMAAATGAAITLLPGETHMAPVERPRALAKAIGEFLKSGTTRAV